MDTGEAGVGRDRAALLPRYAALHADVERYRALFAAAPSALLVTSHNLTIVECNASASQLLDVQERFLIGKPLTAYVDLGSRRLLRPGDGRLRHATTLSLRMRRGSGVAPTPS